MGRSLKERSASPYIIRQVDGADESDVLRELQEPFRPSMPIKDTTDGWWWIAYRNRFPVAYLGMVPSTHYPNAGYFQRVGVLSEHRGNCLQARLMGAMERYARRIGLGSIVSDTTDNVHSANNFIRAGWSLFDPEFPWAFAGTLYWRKDLTP
jgi:GNAT superfamily N-acetyltransferase